MKPLTKTVMLFALLCSFANIQAQTTTAAPRLFDSFSNTINCNASELGRIFSLPAGSNIQVAFANDFIFSGAITSSLQKFANLKTVLIKSSNFNNALFAISKRINEDNSITYVGRILHDGYADGYDLKKNSTGDYSLIKIKLKDILQDR